MNKLAKINITSFFLPENNSIKKTHHIGLKTPVPNTRSKKHKKITILILKSSHMKQNGNELFYNKELASNSNFLNHNLQLLPNIPLQFNQKYYSYTSKKSLVVIKRRKISCFSIFDFFLL